MIGRRRIGRGRLRPVDLATADDGLLDILSALDSAINYRDWILGLSRPYLDGAVRLLEVGAGHGTFTEDLSGSAHVTALELGSQALVRLQRRFAGRPDVSVTDQRLEDLDSDAFDAAFLSNVLEHIEDDTAALSELARVVRPGGSIIVFSPAFMVLYSDFDASIGHHHRYRLPVLCDKFHAAGLEVQESRYVNIVGFFSWLVLVRLLRITPETPGAVRTFDRYVVPWLSRLETAVRVPFGQSVFVVGRVRHAGSG
jgi:2-polyprenyl-3-methyl-5-hydroxy-6-metoxy-1,4-benzoquinol methylase